MLPSHALFDHTRHDCTRGVDQTLRSAREITLLAQSAVGGEASRSGPVGDVSRCLVWVKEYPMAHTAENIGLFAAVGRQGF